MTVDDVVLWAMVGVIAGVLVSMLVPACRLRALVALVAIAVLGALAGGWGSALVFPNKPSTFLASVVVSVMAALAGLAIHRHRVNRSYHG